MQNEKDSTKNNGGGELRWEGRGYGDGKQTRSSLFSIADHSILSLGTLTLFLLLKKSVQNL